MKKCFKFDIKLFEKLGNIYMEKVVFEDFDLIMFVYWIKWIKNIKIIFFKKVIYKFYICIVNDCNWFFLNLLLIYGDRCFWLLFNVFEELKNNNL